MSSFCSRNFPVPSVGARRQPSEDWRSSRLLRERKPVWEDAAATATFPLPAQRSRCQHKQVPNRRRCRRDNGLPRATPRAPPCVNDGKEEGRERCRAEGRGKKKTGKERRNGKSGFALASLHAWSDYACCASDGCHPRRIIKQAHALIEGKGPGCRGGAMAEEDGCLLPAGRRRLRDCQSDAARPRDRGHGTGELCGRERPFPVAGERRCLHRWTNVDAELCLAREQLTERARARSLRVCCFDSVAGARLLGLLLCCCWF